MPLARYFLYVGGVLLSLLFIADAYLPKPPASERADTERPAIRIHSDRKWPERVVFDTSLPTITPARSANAETGIPAPARLRDAFALLEPSAQKQAQLPATKKLEPKPQRTRKIAKRRAPPPMVLVAQQPPIGFFANSTW